MNEPEAKPVRLDIYRTSIPTRGFEHATAARDVAEAVVVCAEYSDGKIGWGETLPRTYVTGETLDSVVEDISEILWPIFLDRTPTGRMSDEPLTNRAPDGRLISAAACALDLAELDRQRPDAPVSDAPPARRIGARVSGVLGSTDPARTAKRLRLMRWYGLRDFKLKLGLGDDVDDENLLVVSQRIGKAVSRGKCTLRVDVNGGWDADSTPQRIDALCGEGVCVVEQPVYCGAGELAELARRCRLPLMADESLLTADDAQALLGDADRVWWNIRISKNGGLRRALRLAELAADRGVAFTIGCMVGESGILSAAQRRLLQQAPAARFVEGNYGRWLLADDLTTFSPRFGYGGRLKALDGVGLGVWVDPGKLLRYGEPVRSLHA